MIDTFDGLIRGGCGAPVSTVRESTETVLIDRGALITIAAAAVRLELRLQSDLESEQRTRCWEFNQKCQRQWPVASGQWRTSNRELH